MSELHDNEARRAMIQLVAEQDGRADLEALRDVYTRRLHQQSGDLDATHGLRLVTAKLRRTAYEPPVVTTSS